ncbi:acyl-CoA desaturase [Chelonus insularis]|uniref:acyl-CoA desaturase n=1 Tax=Chelonus insularis TaxID=460826 RepID=UPI00158DA33D|nr:acyl-CoA desaturase-like [Chelonus insularis]
MSEVEKTPEKDGEIQWHWVLWTIHLYMLGSYGVYTLLANAMWITVFFAIFIIFIGGLGITIGAHRLWAHQSYEAQWYIKLFLMISHTLAGVGPIHDWVLDHRVHHKYYGTNKDPFNYNRGFLYSHLIANIKSKPADFEKNSKIIDMRDIETDGYVWFQRTFYWPLFIIVGLLLPINAPAEYWGESIGHSVLVLGFFRLLILRNMCWLIHSGGHIWALQPHEKFPPDHTLVFLISKSYWHHYHYLLPFDWKCGEFGSYDQGIATNTLKILHVFGAVSGMKTVSSTNVREALYKATSKNKSLSETLEEIKAAAELETVKTKLQYQHH